MNNDTEQLFIVCKSLWFYCTYLVLYYFYDSLVFTKYSTPWTVHTIKWQVQVSANMVHKISESLYIQSWNCNNSRNICN